MARGDCAFKYRNGRSFEERLTNRIDRSGGPDACWPWTGSTVGRGYGRIRIPNGKLALTHRAAYELWVGPIPTGLFVLHKCDNPPCCNPAHHFLGDHLANDRDKRAKGRQPHITGADHPSAKRTPEQIRAIRADKRPIKEIAAEFGVHRSYVHYVKKRRIWASLP